MKTVLGFLPRIEYMDINSALSQAKKEREIELFLGCSDAEINKVLNELNGTKLKVKEFRKQKDYLALKKDVEGFKDNFFGYLKKKKIYIQIVETNIKVETKYFQSDAFVDAKITNRCPHIVISNQKINSTGTTNIINARFITDANNTLMLVGSVESKKRITLIDKSFKVKPFSLPKAVDAIKDFKSEVRKKISKNTSIQKAVYEEKSKSETGSGFAFALRVLFFGELWKVGWGAALIVFLVWSNVEWGRSNDSSFNTAPSSQEQMLKKLGQSLYDKCQLYGKKYDNRC